ncbi:hypothetical protein FRC01_009899 [Tulasnella sp. 417]|nr:hypothetical protein FRC01_009899 [Tulasnella sp. 417]
MPSDPIGFASPWVVLNPPETPAHDVQPSPFINPPYGGSPPEPSLLLAGLSAGPSTASSSSAQQPSPGTGSQEESERNEDNFFAVEEGEEEYVEEWTGRSECMRENDDEEEVEGLASDDHSFGYQGGAIPAENRLGLEDAPDPEGGQNPSISYSNEEEEEIMHSDQSISDTNSDVEMTEEDEAEVDTEDGIVIGYEADRSETESVQNPPQYEQQAHYNQSIVSSSNLSSVSGTPPATWSGRAAAPSPPANQDTSPGEVDVSGPILDSEEGERLEEGAEDPAIEGLANGLSNLVLLPSDSVEPQPDHDATPGDGAQDSPNASSELEGLLGMMQDGYLADLAADLSHMVPAAYEGAGFAKAMQG